MTVERQTIYQSKSAIAYMTDLFKKFNESNLQLQGDEVNLIKAKSVISAFVTKKASSVQTKLWTRRIQPVPKFIRSIGKKDEDILFYCEHLDTLHSVFDQRFDDILKMNIPDWIFDPFSSANTEKSSQLEELMEVTRNDELKF